MNREVLFVLQGEEIRMEKDTVLSGSKYLAHVLEGSPDDPEVRILLPDWVSRRALMMYLDYLRTKSIARVDLMTAQRLLWLADFLFDESLQNSLLYDLIEPQLTCETVLVFLQDAYLKLTKDQSSAHWKKLFEYCMNYAASHAETVFLKCSESLSQLPKKLLELLIETSIEACTRYLSSDYTHIINSLKGLRGANTVLDLLQLEENDAVLEENWTKHMIPVFSWSLKDISLENYFQESPSFEMEGLVWSLVAWSFAHEPTLAVAIRMAPGNHLTRIPKQAILSLVCAIKVSPEETLAPTIVTSVAGTKTQTILRSLTELTPAELRKLTFTLYTKPAYFHSCILTHICANPTAVLDGSGLRGLPEATLVTILNHKRLNVRSEDEVLGVIGKWCQEMYGENMSEDVELCAVLETVHWDYVTLKGLIESVRNYPSLKNSKCYREILQREVEQRGSQNRYSVHDFTSKSYNRL